jgi:hypothetical protein
MDLIVWLSLIGAALALVCFFGGVIALRRRRLVGTAFSFVLGLLFLTLGALFLTISVSTQGYRALTLEETAATIETSPTGAQQFQATVTFVDGRTQTFLVAGDQIYVDAHILKWKPLVNVLGLHTAYELDRIGGRYIDLEQEREGRRSLYSLKLPKPFDMFSLRQNYSMLGPLLDAEYGSATFIAVEEPATFEIRVSTTGLLIRRQE